LGKDREEAEVKKMKKLTFIPMLGLLVLGCVVANEPQFGDLMPGVWNLAFKSGEMNDSFSGRKIKSLWYPLGLFSIIVEKKGVNSFQISLAAGGRLNVEEGVGSYPKFTIKLRQEVGSNLGKPVFESGSMTVIFIDHDQVVFGMIGSNENHQETYFGVDISRPFLRAKSISETEAKNLTKKNKDY
jgi:hypothetical protein